jgi:hypothetical protein
MEHTKYIPRSLSTKSRKDTKYIHPLGDGVSLNIFVLFVSPTFGFRGRNGL